MFPWHNQKLDRSADFSNGGVRHKKWFDSYLEGIRDKVGCEILQSISSITSICKTSNRMTHHPRESYSGKSASSFSLLMLSEVKCYDGRISCLFHVMTSSWITNCIFKLFKQRSKKVMIICEGRVEMSKFSLLLLLNCDCCIS